MNGLSRNFNRWLRSKWVIGAGTAVLIYTLAGFFLAPAIIKSQMLKRLPALTHRHVTVQQVRLNPYALSFTLRGFALTETNGEPFASLGELYVNFELSSIIHRGLVFSEIRLKEPSANIVYLQNGTFNFSNLIPTNEPPAAPNPKPTGKERLPLVMVGTLTITNAGATFTDRHRATPFEQHVGPINIHLSHFTTRPKAGSPYSIVATTDTGGMFAWTGDVGVNPPHSAGRFTLTGLQLKRYAPYVENAAHVDLTGGQIDLQTDYLFDMVGGTPTLAISNAVLDVSKLQVGVTQPKPAHANIDKLHLTVSDFAFDAAARDVSIAEIRLGQLTSGITLLPVRGGTAPSSEPSAPTVATTTAAPSASTNNFQVKVGAIVINDASFRFTDESVQPKVTSAIEQFNGSIKGLTSELNTVAAVDFKGKVNGYSSFTIAGQINPFAKDLFVDLAIAFHDTGLTPISPYLAKYAGFPLEKGSLSLDLDYHVTQQELKAKNNIRVDQLTLGPASGSPDATKLPVKLAIALLQDRHGIISLDVPVTGRLDDPKFKLGPIILQVFMNILTKAATKPFALLGSMFGGGENLDFIAFARGRADFAEGEVNKLDTLARALEDRPALHLEIHGSVDPVKDREALAQIKLDTQLKQARLQELAAAGQRVASIENVHLEPQDRERLLKLAYAEATGLVSARASGSRKETVLAHLETHQNFGPLHPAPEPGAASGEAPPSASALTVADMEKFLIAKTEVTPAEFAALMQERATKVQEYLLQTGKVTADRLAIAPPKAVDASFQGQSRVNLTLQ